MFANCILLATFSMGTLVLRKKTWRYCAEKVMEFGQLMAKILVYESCKSEMNIFKIAQVISKNVPIAFLYVLSIFCKFATELRPFIDVRISFPLNILRTNRQNLTRLCWLVFQNIFQCLQLQLLICLSALIAL